MKLLYIFKSEPDDIVEKLCEIVSLGHQVSVAVLYAGPVDWSGLVDSIFKHDKVICWW